MEYLAVHPSNKGKGVATALVESGMKQVENMGTSVFVHAFKAARDIYLRLGFKEVECVVQDASKYGCTDEYSAYFFVYDVPDISSAV